VEGKLLATDDRQDRRKSLWRTIGPGKVAARDRASQAGACSACVELGDKAENI
jgi:hypothetical protein